MAQPGTIARHTIVVTAAAIDFIVTNSGRCRTHPETAEEKGAGWRTHSPWRAVGWAPEEVSARSSVPYPAYNRPPRLPKSARRTYRTLLSARPADGLDSASGPTLSLLRTPGCACGSRPGWFPTPGRDLSETTVRRRRSDQPLQPRVVSELCPNYPAKGWVKVSMGRLLVILMPVSSISSASVFRTRRGMAIARPPRSLRKALRFLAA